MHPPDGPLKRLHSPERQPLQLGSWPGQRPHRGLPATLLSGRHTGLSMRLPNAVDVIQSFLQKVIWCGTVE